MMIWVFWVLASWGLECSGSYAEQMRDLIDVGGLEHYQCVVAGDDAERQLVAQMSLESNKAHPRLQRALVFVLLRTLQRPWNPKHVALLSPADRRLLADGVRARQGRRSPAEDHHRIFELWEWYEPVSGYTDNRLTQLDRINIGMADNPSEFFPSAPVEGVKTVGSGNGCGCTSSSLFVSEYWLCLFLFTTMVRRCRGA